MCVLCIYMQDFPLRHSPRRLVRPWHIHHLRLKKRKSLSHVQLLATPQTIQSTEFSRPEYWSGQPFPSLGDLLNSGIKPRSLELQGSSLPAEPQGKPKNTGVGSLSLLQGVFLTQELNWGLLHCRQILYQLSYEGSPLYRHIEISHCDFYSSFF